jgi:hypothetical protein
VATAVEWHGARRRWWPGEQRWHRLASGGVSGAVAEAVEQHSGGSVGGGVGAATASRLEGTVA